MNYGNMIDLDNVLWEECLNLYENEDMCTVINDGRVINFVKEKDL